MSNGNALIIPDSRLQQDPSQGCFMADWSMPDGTTIRIEVQPVYCANCGKLYGHVPKENTCFACYFCRKCYQQYGTIAGTYAVPDAEFNRAVQYEMLEAYGRALTAGQLAAITEQGRLTTALQKLEKESPYPNPVRAN